MAWTYNGLIAEMHDRHQLAAYDLISANYERNLANGRWGEGDDHGAIDALIDAVYYNTEAVNDVIAKSYYGYGGSTFLIPTTLDRTMACDFITECPPSEVTMDAVLSAMITADFDELQKFIGIVDAYRVSLWNKPFNVDFYAALTRGFSE